MQGFMGFGLRQQLARIGVLLAGGYFVLLFVGTDGSEARTFANPMKYDSGSFLLYEPLNGGGGVKIGIYKSWGPQGRFDGAFAQNKTAVSEFWRSTSKRTDQLKVKLAGAGTINLTMVPVEERKVKLTIKHNRCGTKPRKVNGISQLVEMRGTINLKGAKGGFKHKKSYKQLWGYNFMSNLPKCAKKREKPIDHLAGDRYLFGVQDRNWFITARPGSSAGEAFRNVDLTASRYSKSGATNVLRTTAAKVRFRLDPEDLQWAEIQSIKKPFSGNARFEAPIGDLPRVWGGNLTANFIDGNYPMVNSSMKVDLLRGKAQPTGFATASVAAGIPPVAAPHYSPFAADPVVTLGPISLVRPGAPWVLAD